MRSPQNTELREIVLSILDNSISRKLLNELVALSHALAHAFLGSKLSKGRLNLPLLKLSLSDVAYDCIADLFQRNDSDELIQLKVYFLGVDVPNSSNEALLAHLRQLVFSKVNQSLFRLYGELDPQLSKILRNIKLSVQMLKGFVETERAGETYLVPTSCDSVFHLPEMPREELTLIVREASRKSSLTPEILSRIALALKEQSDFSRAVPMIVLAQEIRAAFAEVKDPSSVEETATAQLIHDDLRKLIGDVSQAVQTKFHKKYVEKGKLPNDEYDACFAVIRDRIEQTLLHQDDGGCSYFEALKKLRPELTKEDYRDRLKNILEYLGRKTEDVVKTRLRQDYH